VAVSKPTHSARLHAVPARAPRARAAAAGSEPLARVQPGDEQGLQPSRRRGSHPPIAVLGGGPIGMVCALLLARRGIGCVLVDARPLEALQRDRRLLALSRGTLGVLESLLGEEFAARVPRAPIERVLVSSRGNLGSVQLGAADFDGVAVGATVWYADLVGALGRAIEGLGVPVRGAGIEVQRPRRARQVTQQSDSVQILLDDDTVLEAALVIDAEGTPAQAAPARSSALLASVELLGVRAGDAIERFTPDGPLAFLPTPVTATVPAAVAAAGAAPPALRMSMIWCLPAALAQQRLHAPAAQVLAQVAAALGPRIGMPMTLESRGVYPLATHRRDEVCEHRVVHLGNAAQTLHPVAGQGFNLGIRDCTCLVDCLADAMAPGGRAGPGSAGSVPGAGASPGTGARAVSGPSALASARASSLWDSADPLLALERYRRRRRLDRTLVPGLTALLPRVFGSTLAPVVAGRSAALLALDTLPVLRRRFTRLLMFGS